MSKTKLVYFAPHPLPLIKIRIDGFNIYINSVTLKRKYDNLYHNVIKEIMDNDGIQEIDTRQIYDKCFKYDNRYITIEDLQTYLKSIFEENGFIVTFQYDNN